MSSFQIEVLCIAIHFLGIPQQYRVKKYTNYKTENVVRIKQKIRF